MWAIIWIKLKEVGASILTSKIFLWVIVLGGAYLVFMGIFKKDKFENVKLPDSGSGLPQGWGSQQAKILAADGHDVINGFATLANTKEVWATRIIELSNDQLTLIYNAYNEDFGRNEKETMTEAMNNEWNSPLFDSNWSKTIKRLRSLKLY